MQQTAAAKEALPLHKVAINVSSTRTNRSLYKEQIAFHQMMLILQESQKMLISTLNLRLFIKM
jgi:hypothetical protein